jgi:hypothetical protein
MMDGGKEQVKVELQEFSLQILFKLLKKINLHNDLCALDLLLSKQK